MSAPEVVVIDYGVGNLLSVRRGIEHCGANVILTSDPAKILSGQRIVLPGVGAFGNAMQALDDMQLIPVIREVAESGTPILGICLGMQLLLEESEEFGLTPGLGLIPGRVTAIRNRSILNDQLKIPHIGWSRLIPAEDSKWQDRLLGSNVPGDEMYFVHSFMATPASVAHRLADCIYGGHRIPAVIRRGNVFGCQFHPEKSGNKGLNFLQSFCDY
jgi:glutamine amidotransferase